MIFFDVSIDRLLEYEWTRKPDSRTRARVGRDSFPPGVEWWLLDRSDYIRQGGTVEPHTLLYTIKHWWIARLDPGMTFPMHVDLSYTQDRRTWTALQDYTPGHVFLVHNQLIRDYAAGYTLEFDGSELHGAANLSDTPKLSLQCVVEPC